MSEENKFWDDLDISDLPTPPKGRGRKKKTATVTNAENGTAEATNTDGTVTEENETTASSAASFGEESADEPAPIVKKPRTRASSSKKADESASAIENPADEASDGEKTDEPAVTVKKPRKRALSNKKADEPASAIENPADEASDSEKADEPAVAVNDDEAKGEDNDGSYSEPTSQKSIPSKSDGNGGYAEIEHFSDTLEIKYLSDEVEAAYVMYKEEEKPAVDEEYENLKIFEDSEPEVKREPKQKRVREVSPDYKEYNAEKPRRVDARFEFVELFVYTLVVIMLITTFFFKHSQVEGWSMKGTLSDKDHLIISDFLYEPKQYDIVVLHDPEANDAPIVKRIIALGGQTVKLERRLVREESNDMISYYVTNVFVDGVAVPDSFCYYDGSDNIWPANHSNVKVMYDKENPNRFEYFECEYVVPEGEIYVMGDHRNDSKDSRVFGSVNENKILGLVLIRFFPFDSFGTVD